MLLKGECGYEKLRNVPVLAFERRIRPPVRPRQQRDERQRQLSAVRHRTYRRNQCQITLALAGFSPEEITITAEQSTLTVECREPNKGNRDYLYQGISLQPFRRVFNLADYVQVKDATFAKGMLTITLVRELPEAMKPRRIAIETAGNDNQQIEQKQTA